MHKQSTQPEYVVCVFNEPNPISLTVRKVYRVTNQRKDPAECYRIVDDTGEDYLFPTDWFVPVRLTKRAVLMLDAADEAIATF